MTWKAFRQLVNQHVLKKTYGAMGMDCLADVDIHDYYPGEKARVEEYEVFASEAADEVLSENNILILE